MADRSLSIALIMNDESDDVFSVVVTDPDSDLVVDVTDSYEVVAATLPDGRQGVVVVAREVVDLPEII